MREIQAANLYHVKKEQHECHCDVGLDGYMDGWYSMKLHDIAKIKNCRKSTIVLNLVRRMD